MVDAIATHVDITLDAASLMFVPSGGMPGDRLPETSNRSVLIDYQGNQPENDQNGKQLSRDRVSHLCRPTLCRDLTLNKVLNVVLNIIQVNRKPLCVRRAYYHN